MNNKKVYILGAGSSIGHSQGLFPGANDFFRKAKDLNIDIKKEYPQVVDYVQDKLGKDISTGKGAIDIEDLFTYITIELEGNITPDLERIRRQLFVLIQRVLVHLERKVDISVSNAYEEYVSFCSKIGKEDTIITFNWDSLLSKLPSLRAPKGRSNPVFEIASVASLPRNDSLRIRISKRLFRR
ncbi:MAG: hypothetical protein A3G37_00880 [Omnitrophica WOR_2 bacterium RIFCSPLOWO2_12_FULL_46_30]|nr:MAG: hypothetical protein A3D27_00635 [Omnitrophica WOR_2 bacterium RIFCSPHIGHO2_02_FULL_46_37]OGX50450.1 MAG: hypothetical protein A3G37_00880 [Omnitrophica WOR_2 bacterium RIFCSPLOWO2_12_FULL_46_30]